ncbi:MULTISPECIES: DUF1656 domain-containing protein [Bradyrhizobium]|uniref:DUF1656 domain-containing protein n=1 Tax=Bradyrhizobium vignae TaxID=1549949 RepID=A0ABS4A0B8_9BRAD|nr:DUF1656 domain-containing protein [Bradyrhizobium vignae]MBP0113858.1 DUF1656 domain-containing protein [Bradyrhizobium vignae]RXG89316.1 DUF1656 domain-containing protein [Bradyrhizobium vignae]
MTHVHRDFIVGCLLISPIVAFGVMALLLLLLLRPLLSGLGFERLFSNPPLAEFCLYITMFGLLVLFF